MPCNPRSEPFHRRDLGERLFFSSWSAHGRSVLDTVALTQHISSALRLPRRPTPSGCNFAPKCLRQLFWAILHTPLLRAVKRPAKISSHPCRAKTHLRTVGCPLLPSLASSSSQSESWRLDRLSRGLRFATSVYKYRELSSVDFILSQYQSNARSMNAWIMPSPRGRSHKKWKHTCGHIPLDFPRQCGGQKGAFPRHTRTDDDTA